MSSQTTSSSQIIALPKSGDARKGLCKKFLPDLHTSTRNFTAPIAPTPRCNGFQPQFNLAYSTGNGNGYFGLGWNLSIPGLMRTTSKGIQGYCDNDREVTNWGTLLLSGAEFQVPVEDPSLDPFRTTQSLLHTEELFAKMIRINDWKVCSNAEIAQRKVNCHASPRESVAGGIKTSC